MKILHITAINTLLARSGIPAVVKYNYEVLNIGSGSKDLL